MQEPTSEKKQQDISGDYYNYDNITLKLYLEIIESKDETLLFYGKGKPDEQVCSDEWERIIQKNQRTNGKMEFDNYFNLSQSHGYLMTEYLYIKACLSKLCVVVDRELVAELDEKGYKISLENSEKYAESLQNNLRKCENLITKLNSKKKEMDRIAESRGESERAGFQEIMGNLEIGLGFTVPDTLTLARFNEYQKRLREKFKKRETA